MANDLMIDRMINTQQEFIMSHRKIWESAYGAIPKDSEGRSYEIHHIDGDHSNNSLQNLKLVTIEEHYNIHLAQEDWGACWCIAQRMNVPVEVGKKLASDLSKKLAEERIRNGTHNFSSDLSRKTQAARIKEGTHNFQGEQGRVNAVKRNKRLVELGKHPWAGELGKANSHKITELRLSNGTHNFLGENNPNKNMIKLTCPHCNKVGGKNLMKRYHFDNCKIRGK
jgi:hypothetical protein